MLFKRYNTTEKRINLIEKILVINYLLTFLWLILNLVDSL